MVRASAEGVKCKRGNSILSYLDFPFNVRSLLPFSHLSYRAASSGATSVVSQSMQLGSIIIPVIIYELIFLQKILILSDSLFATSIVTVTRETRRHLHCTHYFILHLQPIIEMARVHRVALILTIVATSYLLTLFGVLSVPLVDPKVSEKILPVVHSIFFCITMLF